MDFLSWIVVGLIAGWLAGRVLRAGGYGLVGDIIIGILGGLLGGWLAQNVLKIGTGVSGINIGSILVAFIGAVILLVLLRLVVGRSRSILR
jgi:uncharacterized membrane protein YeaQ/YmgE (transglycosylase-associated protein family)